jgi:hypothetical protein
MLLIFLVILYLENSQGTWFSGQVLFFVILFPFFFLLFVFLSIFLAYVWLPGENGTMRVLPH